MVKKIVTIGNLKQVISDLEDKLGCVDDKEIWIQPAGTPPCEVAGAGLIQLNSGKYVFGIYISGDIF
jgi:hypothetical protein